MEAREMILFYRVLGMMRFTWEREAILFSAAIRGMILFQEAGAMIFFWVIIIITRALSTAMTLSTEAAATTI